MRLHEYSVFARFRYNDLKVGISSGNQALKRSAFTRTCSEIRRQFRARFVNEVSVLCRRFGGLCREKSIETGSTLAGFVFYQHSLLTVSALEE
jgi:hypothetical protein